MKKKLDVAAIGNELAQGSVFFQTRAPKPAAAAPVQEKPKVAPLSPPPPSPAAKVSRSSERKALKFFLPPDCVKHLQMMHFRVNREGGKVEKSELVELAIELLAERLGTQAPALDNKEAVEKYLREG
jgi:hypothetical protein